MNGSNPNSPLIIRAQYVKDLSFENPNPFEALSPSEEEPSINVNFEVKARDLGDRNFEVLLEIRSDAIRDKTTVFVAEVVYGAIVTLDESVTENDFAPLIMVVVPSMLFPFARNIIAGLTRDGGYPPLLLNPVDFGALLKEEAESQEREATIN